MSLRSDIVSFWFWGYRGDLRIELQAPVILLTFPAADHADDDRRSGGWTLQ